MPTLLFLDKNDDKEAVEEGKAPVAVLKERIEGALRKESIVDLCNYHFFDGPMPGRDYLGVQCKDALSISLLQARLNELEENIAVRVG